ncbi:DUF1330 domain-containing protein [Piscinibacter sp.]|uniref:DUF1330 domain-containing protein n=1 Tax=Piscinibacter sp. TaxID=1903157 RepID=UPI002BC3330B|nr:DUF1330 domain-containing protein [Albitalea sp.]HUG23719.1 DUF1330 domain-containing protein [Albitalea sp.]
MPAYLIADVEVTDPAGYAEYSRAIVSTIEAHRGRYLVRGGATEVLVSRLVLVEGVDARA